MSLIIMFLSYVIVGYVYYRLGFKHGFCEAEECIEELIDEKIERMKDEIRRKPF